MQQFQDLFRLITVALALLVCFPNAHAFVVPGDVQYFTKRSADTLYIYPREYAQHLPEVDHALRYFRHKYNQSFAWELDERLILTLASSQNQISNGFATTIPFLETAHYPIGASFLDHYAVDSFMFALNSHETAHLYQLSAKSTLSGWVKRVFGNTPYILLPIGLPIFVFPNAFLPGFMTEGNAMMNESTFGRGGRLWSGEVRAEVLAQVKAGKAGPNRMMNLNLDFPLSEAYHYGGYFMAHVAEEHGLDRTNQFYIHHANRDIWPFNVNKSFRENFGASYTRLIFESDLWLRELASNHRQADGRVLARAFNRPKFNQDQDHIFFIANPTGRSGNQLYKLNRENLGLAVEKTDLPDGKLFFLDGEYFAASSAMVSPTKIQYALFGKGLKPKAGTGDMVWTDYRGPNRLGVDAKTSYVRNNLMKNGEFLDVTASSGLLDDHGNAHYFRQAGEERVLYRERSPLFKYRGFYGILMQAEPSGEVIFIASTETGASLFRFRDHQIERLFPFDNVVEARHVKDDLYLVAAIDSEGYSIQTLTAQPRIESPAWFNYRLPTFSPPAFDESKLNEPSETLSAPEAAYFPSRELRYSMANLWLLNTGFTASALFTDPMSLNLVALDTIWGDDKGASLTYLNNRHRLGWMLSASHLHDKKWDWRSSAFYEDKGSAFLGLSYDLLRRQRWVATLRTGPSWIEKSSGAPEIKRRYGLDSQVLIEYQRHGGALSYEPYRRFFLTAYNQTQYSARTGRNVNNANGIGARVSGDLYRQTFVQASASWQIAEINSIELSDPSGAFSRTHIMPNQLGGGDVKELGEVSLGAKQVLDWSYYFTRFPLSLTRLAPYFLIRNVSTEESGTDNHKGWRREVNLGVELEFELGGIMIVRTASGANINVDSGDERTWQTLISINKNF